MGKLGGQKFPIKVGIIGMSYGISTLLPALHTRPEYKVISIAGSGDPKVSEKCERLIKIGIIPTTSQDLINSEEIDLVVIASPPTTHEEYAISALEAGKNIYCEKPVGINAAATQRINRVAVRSEKIATVGYQFRYDPSIQWLIKRISSGSLGQISRVDIQWETSGATKTGSSSWRSHREQGGGVLRDFASHIFDYMSIIDPLNFPYETGESNVARHTFKSNKVDLDIQEIDFSAQFGTARFSCIVSRNATRPMGHRILIEGVYGGVQVTHKTPFGIGDIYAESWFDGKGKRAGCNPELDLERVTEDSRRFDLDLRQLAVRNLFGDLALEFNGASTRLLPNLSQAISNQLLIDEVEQALYPLV